MGSSPARRRKQRRQLAGRGGASRQQVPREFGLDGIGERQRRARGDRPSALCFQKDDGPCDQVVSFDVIDADSGTAIPSFKADFTEASTSAYVGTETLAPGDKMKYQSADYYVSITAPDYIDTHKKPGRCTFDRLRIS